MLFWKDRLGLDLYPPTSTHPGGFCIPSSAGIPAGGQCPDEVAGAGRVPRMGPDMPTPHRQARLASSWDSPCSCHFISSVRGRPSTRSSSGHRAALAHSADEPEVRAAPWLAAGRAEQGLRTGCRQVEGSGRRTRRTCTRQGHPVIQHLLRKVPHTPHGPKRTRHSLRGQRATGWCSLRSQQPVLHGRQRQTGPRHTLAVGENERKDADQWALCSAPSHPLASVWLPARVGVALAATAATAVPFTTIYSPATDLAGSSL